MRLDEDFDGDLSPRWATTTPGGAVVVAGSRLRLALPATQRGTYSNAQIDDYTGLRASHYPWRPPLRLEVRARASHPASPPESSDDTHEGSPSPRGRGGWGVRSTPSDKESQSSLHGTAGFGFWNYPLTRAGGVPRLPNAAWFFAASPPSNMALVPGVPGWGWKAQVVHAHRWRSLAEALPTLGAVGWARLSGRTGIAAQQVRRFTGAVESHIAADFTVWHTYSLEWRPERADFWVDGAPILSAAHPPAGPLGFVAWIDNQYAVATPTGSLRFGTLSSSPQWLEIDHIRIAPT